MYAFLKFEFSAILSCYIHFMSHTATYTGLQAFSAGSLDRKVANKLTLQHAWGWVKEPKRAMVCFPFGMTDKLGGSLLKELLPGILSLNCELVILGKGSAEYGTLFTNLQKKHPHRVKILKNDPEEIEKMLAACDMAMCLAEPDDSEIQECLRNGVVPVSLASPYLADYNPVQESGNAFVFEQPVVWHAFGALVRALETFKFPYDWRTIQRHAMESVQK